MFSDGFYLMRKLAKSKALSFILILGLVNLFADMTYEGASSINGPFLGTVGASALAIGTIAGLGEFLGYSLRFIFGYISDKTGKYWLITFIGYGINLLSVPALALVNNWPLAACFMVSERIGRAIRKPTVEAMLSYTTDSVGKGWAYGINTALDQIGATLGPIFISLALLWHASYKISYALLLIPALLALATLAIAMNFFSNPTQLETTKTAKLKSFTSAYWLYMTGGACIAAGLVSFELISYHFASTKTVTDAWIPLFFAVAMATNALASLIFGKLFDKIGITIVIISFLLSAFFAPFVFLGKFYLALFGMILWGIGFGAQDTLLKAIIAGILPKGKRNLAFGLFYTGYGAGWLIGSIITGLLYTYSLYLVVAFSMILQFISLPFFIMARKNEKKFR